MGDFKTGLNIPFNHSGAMAFVASSPNDPVFVNHHIMVDCVLEQIKEMVRRLFTLRGSFTPLCRRRT